MRKLYDKPPALGALFQEGQLVRCVVLSDRQARITSGMGDDGEEEDDVMDDAALNQGDHEGVQR